MRQFKFACLNMVAAEEIFEDFEDLLSGFAQTCEQFDELEKFVLLSALQSNGLTLVRPIASGFIFDLNEWAKVIALIEMRTGKELDSQAIEAIILPFVMSISNQKRRVYADDGNNIASFVNARISGIIRSLRSKVRLAHQFKEERV